MRSFSWHMLVLMVLTLTAPSAVLAQDSIVPVDLGLLRDEEIAVVQKILYTMEGRSELGIHLGIMPFDPYTTAPVANVTYGRHRSETLGWEVALGAGYGFKNATYRELEGPTYGIAPEAYRFLARGLASVEWSPIYAKMSWRGKRVYHYNTYLLGGLGANLEQVVLPTGAFAVAPTVGWGVGFRVFRTTHRAFRIEFRDDVLIERRVQTATTAVKQNPSITFGISRIGEAS